MVRGIVIPGVDMPDRCVDCPCFDYIGPGRCNVKGIIFSEDDQWVGVSRAGWCPLRRLVVDDGKGKVK